MIWPQILDTMGAAAELMSTPPRLLEQGTAADPRVKPHLRLAAAMKATDGGNRLSGACLSGTSITQNLPRALPGRDQLCSTLIPS